MGNPWEVVRNDVSYLVKFYGKVESGSDGKKHWIGGEDIKAVAYDVPIPGYKTKNTINLRLWSTKASSEDFDLHAFNTGEHTKAYEALANAEKVWMHSSLHRHFFLMRSAAVSHFFLKILTSKIVWGHRCSGDSEILKLGDGVGMDIIRFNIFNLHFYLLSIIFI